MKSILIVVFVLIICGTTLGQNTTGAAATEPPEEPTFAEIAPEDRVMATGRDMSNIRTGISEVKEVIESDYGILLATDPSAEGTLTISFSITPEGAVVDPMVECTEELTGFQDNILAALTELEFGPATEQTEDIPVTVPFTLAPPQ